VGKGRNRGARVINQVTGLGGKASAEKRIIPKKPGDYSRRREISVSTTGAGPDKGTKKRNKNLRGDLTE